MSYDIWLEIETGDGKCLSTSGKNHTSNVTDIWELALGFQLKDLKNKKAKDCINDLQQAMIFLNDPNNKDHLESMNPPNNWGNYRSATEFLEWLLEECRSHPNCTIKMWY